MSRLKDDIDKAITEKDIMELRDQLEEITNYDLQSEIKKQRKNIQTLIDSIDDNDNVNNRSIILKTIIGEILFERQKLNHT
jgi:uncharacterized phage infection (PIP) family protein YhgE